MSAPQRSGSAHPVSGPVLVTGAGGRLGRVVVQDLVAHGVEVVAVDRTELVSPSAASRVHQLDGRDADGLIEAMQGCVGLVHLAAIPYPVPDQDVEVFANNTQSTFVALHAAAAVGITRAVIASSVSGYGTAWSPEPTRFDYVPVDEGHPIRNADPYGLSKEVDERTATMINRRTGMSIAALRFHWIASAEEILGAVDGVNQVQDAGEIADQLRGLWGYVEVGDAARACRLALAAAEREPYGFQPLNVTAADTLSRVPLGDLLAAHAPETGIRSGLGPTTGGFAIDRARDVIGWEPQHSWR